VTQEAAQGKAVYRVRELSSHSPTAFHLRPTPDVTEAICTQLGLSGLRKLSFVGDIRSEGRRDWRLKARIGATVVQPCVVSLQPVTTRLDEDITRLFVAEMPDTPLAEEQEMPEDDTQEPLGDVIDLEAVMIEALALALPDYPRSDDARFEGAEMTPPGADPITPEETKPFAALAGLKKKLDQGD